MTRSRFILKMLFWSMLFTSVNFLRKMINRILISDYDFGKLTMIHVTFCAVYEPRSVQNRIIMSFLRNVYPKES